MVSEGERRAYRDVRAVAAAHGASVHVGTKLSDLADPKHAGDDSDWATRAHVELLVRSEDDLSPLFAIEVDGKQHLRDPERVRRDRLKDRLLEGAGIDVIRVSTTAVDALHGRYRTSAYLADLWFSARSFETSQSRGDIPPDESFFHPFTFVVDERTGDRESLDPTLRFRSTLIRDAATSGIPAVPRPQTWLRRQSATGLIEARMVLAMTDGLFLYADAALLHFRIPGVLPRDVVEEVGLLDLQWQYVRWLADEAVGRRVSEIGDVLPAPVQRYDPRSVDVWQVPHGDSEFADWLAAAIGNDAAAKAYPVDFGRL